MYFLPRSLSSPSFSPALSCPFLAVVFLGRVPLGPPLTSHSVLSVLLASHLCCRCFGLFWTLPYPTELLWVMFLVGCLAAFLEFAYSGAVVTTKSVSRCYLPESSWEWRSKPRLSSTGSFLAPGFSSVSFQSDLCSHCRTSLQPCVSLLSAVLCPCQFTGSFPRDDSH